jgi:hypothetical protein
MGKALNKAQRRLNQRITSWNNLPSNKKGKENGYRKPGSMKIT